MSVPQITGQYLIDATNDLLGGYQNGVDSRAMMTFLNEAKDEIFSVTKELHEEYFQVFSQATDSTLDYYFGPLNSTTREYTLPADLRSIEFIECVTPTYEKLRFTYAKLNSPAFRDARIEANAMQGPDTSNCEEYVYSIAGKDQFVLASYPPTTLTLILWYTRALPDFEMSDVVDEILFPFSKKIAEYAAQRAMLSLQDPGMFAAWKATWRDSLINLVQAEGTRNDADATFVQDFMGDC
ncbi:MAG TPA: hypothetical protein VI386_17945 [Candidatus Sulfotelmatobacter sp.]